MPRTSLEFGKAIYFGPQPEQQADYLDGQIGGNLFGSAITGAGMISLLLKGPEVFGLAASATSTVFKALYPRLPKLAELLTQLKKCKKLEAHVDEKHVVRMEDDAEPALTPPKPDGVDEGAVRATRRPYSQCWV